MTRKARRRPPPASPAPPATEAPVGAQTTSWWQVTLIVACAAVLYLPGVSLPFIFDDDNAILSNASIRDVWPPWVPLAPPADTPVAGRPVVNLTFALNYAAGGLEVEGYRLVNIGLHVLNTLLVLALVRRTLASPALRGRFGAGADAVALASALIWEAHALHTETVVYVTQRTELMVGLFYLLTLYCAVRARTAPSPAVWIAGAIAACGAGMGSKEVMVTAPLMVPLYDVAFAGEPIPTLWRQRRPLYIGLAATWVILIALLIPGPRSGTVGFGGAVSPLAYLASQTVSLTTYFKLAFWPSPLVLHYGYATETSLADVWPHALAALALLGGTVWAWRRMPALGFVPLWTLGILLPTTSIVPIVTEVTAERRMYLPLVTLVVAAVLMGRSVIGRAASVVSSKFLDGFSGARRPAGKARRPSKSGICEGGATPPGRGPQRGSRVGVADGMPRPENVEEFRGHDTTRATPGAMPRPTRVRTVRLARMGAALGIVIVLGTLVRARVAEFGSEVSVWQTVVDRRPANPAGHLSLGAALAHAGRSRDAIAHYREALALGLDEEETWKTHFNLGQELMRVQAPDEALPHLEYCLERNPAHPTVRYLLGQILGGRGRTEEAAAHYRAALAIDPGFDAARVALANSLMALDRPSEAAAELRALLEKDPDNLDLEKPLALALALSGELEAAIAMYRRVLARTPDAPELHVQMGLTYAELGDRASAAASYQQALARAPDDVEAHYHLANLRMSEGAIDEAIGHYEAVLRISPAHAEAHFNLAAALARVGRAGEALQHAHEAQRLLPGETRVAQLIADLER